MCNNTKRITIHQGDGDDLLEMTVNVTRLELNKMEEIRKKNPSAWIGKEFDLFKETKNQLAIRKEHRKAPIGILVLSIVLLSILIISIVVKNNNGKVSELTEGEMQEESIYQCFDEINGQNRTLAETNDNNGMYKIWEKSVKFGYKGTFDDFFPFFNESEENRQKVWTFHVKNGYKGTFEEFLSFAGMPKDVQDIHKEIATTAMEENENIRYFYDVLSSPENNIDLGTYEEFDNAMRNDPETRKWVFDKSKSIGIDVGDYSLYENAILGTTESQPTQQQPKVDWEQVLADFIVTKKAKPNLAKEEWFSIFPEFNNDENLLQAAFDYEATVNAGKYSDPDVLHGKFPEFWPNKSTTNYYDNIGKLYHDAKKRGMKWDENQFRSYLSESQENRINMFHDLKKRGMKWDENQFLEYIGYSSNGVNLEKARILYDALSEDYDLGYYNEFINSLSCEKNRRTLFDSASDEYDLGTWEDFNKKLGFSTSPITNETQKNTSNPSIKAVQWPIYSIPNVCSITVPPTMELRDDDSNSGRLFSAINPLLYKMMCNNCDVFSDHSSIVFQPEGMNSDNPKDIDRATATYARIIIEFGNNYDVSQEDVKSMTSADFVEYDKIVGGQFQAEFDYAQQALGRTGSFVWHPTKREKIGGMYCLVIDYDRSGLQGMVKVKKYIFYYNGKEIDLTLSYRISEKGKYEKDFERVINSIKIHNK